VGCSETNGGEMRLTDYLTEASKPELKDGEYAVPHIKKEKVRDLNPRTNRMKNFKRTNWHVTDIPPEKRTFKNLPRYSTGDPMVRFTDWLEIKGNPGKGCDGKWYGWSHRAVYGFSVGDIVKMGHIGNKHQYGPDVEKKYNEIMRDQGYEIADKWRDSIKFDPYTIETEEEAKEHAYQFMRGVS